MKAIEQAAAGQGAPLSDFAGSPLEISFDAYDYAKCVWRGDPDPANCDNIPKWQADPAYNPVRYGKIRLEGRFTPEYYLVDVELRNGLRSHYGFEDI